MSDVYTKQDFLDRAVQDIADTPELATLYQAGDVFVMQNLGAMAQMLALLSFQIGLGETEPWTRARDTMVLSDAAAKGILPFAKPPKWKINAKNNSTLSNALYAGRKILDAKGRSWVITDGVTVAAGDIGSFNAEQRETETFSHTVSQPQNFYKIPVPLPTDGRYLVGLDVVRNSDSRKFSFFERYSNTAVGDFVYHMLSDETGALWIEFGVDGIAGYRPQAGEVFNISLTYTYGETQVPSASKFGFEYSFASETDANTEMYADSMVFGGANPLSIPDLRELTSFPSMYDTDAVHLGNFHFLVASKLSPFIFLSIWNEQIEEAVRGANIGSINKLFVSFVKDGEVDSDVQANIKAVIAAADSSYGIVFVTTVERQVPISVALRLSPVHDEAAVLVKVNQLILKEYGRTSAWAKRGRSRINSQATVKLLRDSIVELQDGQSDVSVLVTELESSVKPEEFRYVSDSSLTVTNVPLVFF